MLTRAIVRSPSRNFADGLTSSGLPAPDYELGVKQHEAYAANCLALGKTVLIAAGNRLFEAQLRELGFNTEALEMSEFEKMDGGLSCLSLRF